MPFDRLLGRVQLPDVEVALPAGQAGAVEQIGHAGRNGEGAGAGVGVAAALRPPCRRWNRHRYRRCHPCPPSRRRPCRRRPRRRYPSRRCHPYHRCRRSRHAARATGATTDRRAAARTRARAAAARAGAAAGARAASDPPCRRNRPARRCRPCRHCPRATAATPVAGVTPATGDGHRPQAKPHGQTRFMNGLLICSRERRGFAARAHGGAYRHNRTERTEHRLRCTWPVIAAENQRNRSPPDPGIVGCSLLSAGRRNRRPV